MVRYRQLKPTVSLQSTVNVTDISQHCVVIEQLKQSAVYQVSMSCFNAACFGPFSDSVQFIVHDEVLQTAPSNVTALPVNSTSIQVTFLPPHFTERSDLFYVIIASRDAASSNITRVKRNSVSDDENSVQKNSAGRHIVTVSGRLLTDSVHSDYVTDLDKFTTYHVTVHCLTEAATGPASLAVTVHTLDDGRFCILRFTAALDEQKFVFVVFKSP